MTPEDSGKANRSSISTYRDYLYAAGRLAAAVAVRVEGKLHDLCGPAEAGAEAAPVVIGSPDGLDILRHSTSHIMAEAVGNLYKNVRFDIGPAIEDGFYYDFDLDGPIGAEVLE
jgi:threonyl-tRNA synthetase